MTSIPAERRSSRLLIGLLVLLAVNALLCNPDWVGCYQSLAPRAGLDFFRFYCAAWTLRVGQNVYGEAFEAVSRQVSGQLMVAGENYHPPGWYALLLPFTSQPMRPATVLFEALSCCIFLFGVSWFTAVLFDNWKPARWAGLGIALAVIPSPIGVDNLALGNVGLLCTGLLGITYAAAMQRRPTAAGVALGVAALSKVYPILLLGSFLNPQRQTRRAGQVAIAALTTLLLAHLLVLGLAGPDTLSGFFTSALGVPVKTGDHSLTLPAVLLGFFPQWSDWGQLLSRGMLLAGAAVYLGGALKARSQPARRVWFAVGILVFQTLTPFCWAYQRALNLLPLLVALREVRAARPAVSAAALALTAGMLLEGDLVWTVWMRPVHIGYRQAGLGALVGLVGLLGLMRHGWNLLSPPGNMPATSKTGAEPPPP